MQRSLPEKKFQAKMGLEYMANGIPMRTIYPNGKISSQKCYNK